MNEDVSAFLESLYEQKHAFYFRRVREWHEFHQVNLCIHRYMLLNRICVGCCSYTWWIHYPNTVNPSLTMFVNRFVLASRSVSGVDQVHKWNSTPWLRKSNACRSRRIEKIRWKRWVVLSWCILAQSDTTLFSVADVPCGREGESNHAICQRHDNRDILL